MNEAMQGIVTNYKECGLARLRGRGLEIGAMHNPTVVHAGCVVEYFDVVSREQAMKLFPEVPADSFRIDPKYLGDVDKIGLSIIGDEEFDFAILNHVIEHVANPIRLVGEMFRVVKRGGHVVLACPDKRHTFDKNRALTPFDHLLEEYVGGISEVTDEHYLDFLRAVHPEVMTLPPEQVRVHVESVRSRREHAHVWDSASFRDFLDRTMELLGLGAACVYEVQGDETKIEHFSIWEKK
jgi:SAM-dependent methyltransferase